MSYSVSDAITNCLPWKCLKCVSQWKVQGWQNDAKWWCSWKEKCYLSQLSVNCTVYVLRCNVRDTNVRVNTQLVHIWVPWVQYCPNTHCSIIAVLGCFISASIHDTEPFHHHSFLMHLHTHSSDYNCVETSLLKGLHDDVYHSEYLMIWLDFPFHHAI